MGSSLKEMIDGAFDAAEELIKVPGQIMDRSGTLASKAFDEVVNVKEESLDRLKSSANDTAKTLHARHDKPKKPKKAKNHKPS